MPDKPVWDIWSWTKKFSASYGKSLVLWKKSNDAPEEKEPQSGADWILEKVKMLRSFSQNIYIYI